MIENAYKTWLQNPVDMKHVKEVETKYGPMESQFDKLQKYFNDKMTQVSEIKSGIDFYLKAISNEPGNAMKTSERLDRIYERQHKLIGILEKITNILNDYNNQRVAWLKFFMGMKEETTSDRKVVKTKSTKKENHKRNFKYRFSDPSLLNKTDILIQLDLFLIFTIEKKKISENKSFANQKMFFS